MEVWFQFVRMHTAFSFEMIISGWYTPCCNGNLPRGNLMLLLQLGNINCDRRDWPESDHPCSQTACFSAVNTKDSKFCSRLRTMHYISSWTLMWKGGLATNCTDSWRPRVWGGVFGVILHLLCIWFINWIWSLFLFLSKGKLFTS